jgi:hypothetical protein
MIPDTLPTLIQEETMIDTILMIPKASDKIRLNPLTPFTGKQNEFVLFMQDVYIYLKVNDIYTITTIRNFLLYCHTSLEEMLPSRNNDLSR